MSFISQKLGQFTYFDTQLGKPAWEGKHVLDFGGNIGNILKDDKSTIDHERYWCLDVSCDAIALGKETWPEAHWIHYNRYNFAFNPQGRPGLALPALGQQFDYILAYSVFTHISPSEMLVLVRVLRGLLKTGGYLTFTFIDPHYQSWPTHYDGTNLQWRLAKIKRENPTVHVEALLAKAKNASWCILVNDDDLYVESEDIKAYAPHEQHSYHAYYTPAYMRTLFPDAVIAPPVHGEMQHCGILRRAWA